jgi:Fic family protein
MLSLKDAYEDKMKTVMGSSYSNDLLQLMFTIPYLTIELMQKKQLAHRQTASAWLKKLSDADIVRPHKLGRKTYYINYALMDLLSKE